MKWLIIKVKKCLYTIYMFLVDLAETEKDSNLTKPDKGIIVKFDAGVWYMKAYYRHKCTCSILKIIINPSPTASGVNIQEMLKWILSSNFYWSHGPRNGLKFLKNQAIMEISWKPANIRDSECSWILMTSR